MAKQSFPVTSAQEAVFDVALTAEEQEKLPPISYWWQWLLPRDSDTQQSYFLPQISLGQKEVISVRRDLAFNFGW